MKDKTVIIIAHRLSTVRGADKILVIDEGRLAEEGRHNELHYYDMVVSQMGLAAAEEF